MIQDSTFPYPEIRTEQGKTVKTWRCECGQEIGEFSAWRMWTIHGKIICGECAQKEDPEYQEYLKEKNLKMY